MVCRDGARTVSTFGDEFLLLRLKHQGDAPYPMHPLPFYRKMVDYLIISMPFFNAASFIGMRWW